MYQEIEELIIELQEIGFLAINKNDFNVIDYSRLQEATRNIEDNSGHQEFNDYLYEHYNIVVSYKSVDMGSLLLFNIDDLCDCENEEDHLIIDCE